MTRSPGSGHIFVRALAEGDVWYGQWWADGRKIKRRLGAVRVPGQGTGLTRKGAEAELRRLMESVTPEPKASLGLTIDQAGEVYLTHLRRAGRKKATLTAVELPIRVWFTPFFRGLTLDRITLEHVEDLVLVMEAKPLSAKSIQNYIGTLGALFTFGLHPKRRWVVSNPVVGVELPAVLEASEVRFLTLEQVDALLRAIPDGPYGPLDRVLVLAAAMTGLRQGELVALRWQDVDWPASRIRVRQNYVLGEFDTPKSRRSTRSVPLAERLAVDLARWQPPGVDESVLVFPDPATGGPLGNAAILRRLRRALNLADLPPHRFHDLRHTFGTAMAAHGVPMRTLQEWMGHRDIQTTMRYADYAPSAHEAQLVDAAFRRGGVSGGVLTSPGVTERHEAP